MAIWKTLHVIDTSLAQKTGWLIAVSRLLIATLIMLMAVTDPFDETMEILLHQPDDAWAFGYLALSLALVILFHADWYLSYRARPIVLLIDVIFYLGIMIWIEPMDSGYFAATFAMLTFLVITVNLQWGWRLGLAGLAGANAVCLAMIAHMHFAHSMMDESILIRRQAYLVALSLFLLLTTVRFQNVIVRRHDAAIDGDADGQLAAALHYAMEQLGAKGGALCWARYGVPSCGAKYAGVLARSSNCSDRCSTEFVHSVDGATMFDLGKRHAVEILDDRFHAISAAQLDRDFLRQAAAQDGIFIPLLGVSGRGRLLLTAIPFRDVSQLSLAQTVGTELQRHLDAIGFHEAAEQMALLELRQSIARDLHDSVAQSISGTRYWLQSLKPRIRSGEITTDHIDAMAETLAEEHANLRTVIEHLRIGDIGFEEVDLVSQLNTVADPLSRLWGISIAVASPESTILASQQLVHESMQFLREAVANAVRHGQADTMRVSINRRNGNLELVFIDNGQGFDSAKPGVLPRSIQGRVAKLGGKIEVESRLGHTEVSLTIPNRRSVHGRNSAH